MLVVVVGATGRAADQAVVGLRSSSICTLAAPSIRMYVREHNCKGSERELHRLTCFALKRSGQACFRKATSTI